MVHSKKSFVNILTFSFRTVVMLFVLFIWFFKEGLIDSAFYGVVFLNIHVYQIVWFLLVLFMIKSMIPKFNMNVRGGKIFKANYEGDYYSKEKLNKEIVKANKGALKSFIFWNIILFLIGIFYYFHVISKSFLLFVIPFIFYWGDKFCILIWCPFRKWLIKNRCCNTCRIYNWGYLMVVSPLLFVFNFYTYSLIFLSLIIFLRWEYTFYKFPERFFSLSNKKLRCSNCLKGQCIYN